jgi:tetratricopeptide (TPR) repeat protein
MVNKFRASTLILFVFLTSQSLPGQTPALPTGKATAPVLIKLTGEDEKRARNLKEQIDKALKADRWDEAIARAEEMLALRARAQGPKHFETVSEDWRLKVLRRVAPMPNEDRVAYQSASAINEQAEALNAQGKFAQAQPLYERALEIRRRLLTDDHPDTARSYIGVAYNWSAQGKYAQAQALYETALEILRPLLTDDHSLPQATTTWRDFQTPTVPGTREPRHRAPTPKQPSFSKFQLVNGFRTQCSRSPASSGDGCLASSVLRCPVNRRTMAKLKERHQDAKRTESERSHRGAHRSGCLGRG